MPKVTKSIQGFPITSENLFDDLLLPLIKRNYYSLNKPFLIPVISYRYLGIKTDISAYYDQILQLDQTLLELTNRYLRFSESLKNNLRPELTTKMQSLLEKEPFQKNSDFSDQLSVFLTNNSIFPTLNNHNLQVALATSFTAILKLYLTNQPHFNATLVKNFTIKILNWLHDYLPLLFQDYEFTLPSDTLFNPKVLFYGDIKEHEVYFLILLTMLGTDLLYINPTGADKFTVIDPYSRFAFLKKLPNIAPLKKFPAADQIAIAKNNPHSLGNSVSAYFENATGKSESLTPAPLSFTEKTFEELAALSASTVMIRSYDRAGNILGAGSGVVIDANGLIVTNYHVIHQGVYYGIIFEGMNEASQYETYTVVNFDRNQDLALLKIGLSTTPIPINPGEQIGRGQKVVAIGSPLGLMNTFSDGLISGVRQINNCDYLQTSAPISPGSSGGALLNMYGHLIGITTAGYIDGQNLNLAVSSKYILDLLKQKYTLINQEIIIYCSTLSFEGTKLIFDALFNHQNITRYQIALYQSHHDQTDFLNLTKNKRFRQALQDYYQDLITKVLAKHQIRVYDFELGAQNYHLAFSYNQGRVSNLKWGPIHSTNT